MTIAIILYKSSTVVILNIGFRLKLSTNEIFYYSLSFMLRSMCAVQKQMNCEHISVIGLLKWFHITRRPYCRWIKIISILDFNTLKRYAWAETKNENDQLTYTATTDDATDQFYVIFCCCYCCRYYCLPLHIVRPLRGLQNTATINNTHLFRCNA